MVVRVDQVICHHQHADQQHWAAQLRQGGPPCSRLDEQLPLDQRLHHERQYSWRRPWWKLLRRRHMGLLLLLVQSCRNLLPHPELQHPQGPSRGELRRRLLLRHDTDGRPVAAQTLSPMMLSHCRMPQPRATCRHADVRPDWWIPRQCHNLLTFTGLHVQPQLSTHRQSKAHHWRHGAQCTVQKSATLSRTTALPALLMEAH